MNRNDSFQSSIEQLRQASPFDIPNLLIDMELYDKETAEDLFEKINNDFQKEDIINNVVTPVMTSVIDGVLTHKCFKGTTQKLGLSSTRVIQECQSFNYDGNVISLMPDAFVEYRNRTATEHDWGKENRSQYIRSVYENTYKMNQYKEKKREESGEGKNMIDEYRRKTDITPEKNNPDYRRKDTKHYYNAETDHIIPLEELFKQIQNNSGLSDGDIKKIANQEDNLAMTARFINNSKRSMTNSEFIAKQDQLKAEGKPYIELSPEDRENMIQMEKMAQKSINNSINSTIIDNLTGRGTVDKQDLTNAINKKQEELGRKLTQEEIKKINSELVKQKTLGIHITNAKNAGKQTIDYAIGASILFIIKPLYYEIKDGICYGFKEGVYANTYHEAFKIRFSRIKEYVWKQLTSLKSYFSSGWDMIKNFISSLLEGLIGMFVGMFQKIFKVLKEGVKVFVQTWPILFGEQSKNMSPRQKGDALIKLLGGSVVALCGIGLNLWLNNVAFIPEDFKGVISTMATGLASVILFYALDKADLFNVKEEKRKERVREIFSERIKDIQEKTSIMNNETVERLRIQKMEFMHLINSFDDAIKKQDNYTTVNEILFKIATNLNICSVCTANSTNLEINNWDM